MATAGDEDEARRRHWRWPVSRIALAAQLHGAGWTFDEIARHPNVRSSVQSVRRALKRAGVDLDDFRRGRTIRVMIRHPDLPALDAAAQTRRIDLPELIERLVRLLAEEPALISNVFDDGR
ncbi:MAG: hypothetical protein Q8M31_21735 [Beijerinckiaceae bacterium]|nr:hypothetical protein [Beijerinckiaceae bacterium]